MRINTAVALLLHLQYVTGYAGRFFALTNSMSKSYFVKHTDGTVSFQ
jgi:hypothetical protein